MLCTELPQIMESKTTDLTFIRVAYKICFNYPIAKFDCVYQFLAKDYKFECLFTF